MLLVLFSYPLLVLPGRTSLLALVARCDSPGSTPPEGVIAARFWGATVRTVHLATWLAPATLGLLSDCFLGGPL